MTTVYRIKDWRKHFEVSQSLRIVGPLAWVGVPTKHDGKSFRRLVSRPNGPALFGCWSLIVQIAAKCPIRGVLADSDGPLSSEDMECKTGCPATLFTETIQLLLSKQINWLEEADFSVISEHPPPDLGEETELAPSTEPDITEQIRPAGPVGDSAGGNLNGHEPVSDRVLKILSAIKQMHLARDIDLEAIQASLDRCWPGFLPSGDDGFLRLLGAAERAIHVGKKPVALFVSLVKDRRWDLIDEGQQKSAKQRFDLYRKRQAEANRP